MSCSKCDWEVLIHMGFHNTVFHCYVIFLYALLNENYTEHYSWKKNGLTRTDATQNALQRECVCVPFCDNIQKSASFSLQMDYESKHIRQ